MSAAGVGKSLPTTWTSSTWSPPSPRPLASGADTKRRVITRPVVGGILRTPWSGTLSVTTVSSTRTETTGASSCDHRDRDCTLTPSISTGWSRVIVSAGARSSAAGLQAVRGSVSTIEDGRPVTPGVRTLVAVTATPGTSRRSLGGVAGSTARVPRTTRCPGARPDISRTRGPVDSGATKTPE